MRVSVTCWRGSGAMGCRLNRSGETCSTAGRHTVFSKQIMALKCVFSYRVNLPCGPTCCTIRRAKRKKMQLQAVWDLQVNDEQNYINKLMTLTLFNNCLIQTFFSSTPGFIHDTERRKSDGGGSAMTPLKVSLIQDMR